MNGFIKRLTVFMMCVALVISAPLSALAEGWDGSSASQTVQPGVEGEADSTLSEDNSAQASTNVSILVISGLEIIGQTEDCYIAVGDDLELGVAVSGVAPFTYKWEISTDNGATWQTIEGADTDRYQMTDAQLNPNGMSIPYSYRVTVEDEYGHTDSTIINITVLEDEDEFSYRRIPNSEAEVAVSAWMHKDTDLAAEKLGEGDPAYDELYRHLTPGCLPVNTVDLALFNKTMPTGHFVGKQKVEFIVGDEYEGQTLKVFQLVDGKTVEYTGEVIDGILTIEVDKLTQFMVEAPSDKARVLTVVAGEGGSTDPEGSVTVMKGDDKTVVFLPDEGFVVDQVTLDGAPVEFSGNSITISNMTEDHLLEVTFREVVPTDELHEVNVVCGENGSASPAGITKVKDGESFTIAITPDAGYIVDKILVNGVEYEAVGSFLTLSAVLEDTTVEISFRKSSDEPIPTSVTITASAGEGGSISPAGEVDVSYGGEMYFYIIPDDGYVVDKVYVDDVEVEITDDSYQFINVVKDHTIRATFKEGTAPEKEFYTVTAESGKHGSISPEGKTTVPAGGRQTFHFQPDSGYVVKAVYVNGKLVATRGLSYTLKDINADTTIRVEFSPVSLIPTGDITTGPVPTVVWVLLGAAGTVAVLMIILIVIRRKKDDDEEDSQNQNG